MTHERIAVSPIQEAIDQDSKLIDASYSEAAKTLGMSDSTFDILYTLVTAGEGLSQKEVAERCFTRKQTLSSAVKKLEAEGILRIEPRVGHTTALFLTDSGYAYARKRVAPVVRAETAAIESVPQELHEQITAALHRYALTLARELSALEPVGEAE